MKRTVKPPPKPPVDVARLSVWAGCSDKYLRMLGELAKEKAS